MASPERILSQLTEDAARLSALLDAAVDGVVIMGETGEIEAFSKSAARMFGYRSSEVIGKNVSILMPEPDRSKHDSYLRAYLETGNAKIIGIGREVTALRRDGSEFPADLSVGEAIRGGRRCFVGFVRDITGRKAVEEKMRLQDEELQLTLQKAPTGVVTADLFGHCLSVNQAACRMFGYNAKELIGKPFRKLMVPSHYRETVSCAIRIIRGEIKSMRMERQFRRKDGSLMHGIMHCGAIHDEAGQVIRLVTQIEDRTHQVLAEEKLRQQEERLTHVTRLSVLGEMVAGIAHEINQPLTAIKTYAEACDRLLASDANHREDIATTMKQISRQALRAAEVLQRLRRLAKRGQSERHMVNVQEVVTDAVKLAEVDARIHGQSIETSFDRDLPAVVADPIQVQQVLLNLLRNGMESMEQAGNQGIPIRINAHKDGDRMIRVDVTDSGAGIDPEHAPHIFEPFQTSKDSGMGIGLAISRSIIDSHGGKLAFERNPGHGVTFYFTLPTAGSN